MTTAAEFIAAGRAYLGTPWHHQGRSVAGVDCIGLVLLAARDAGLEALEPPPYTRLPTDYALAEACAAIGKRAPLDALRDGDVLLFSDAHFPCHIGIRTTLRGVPHCLHSRASRRRVVEEPLTHDVAHTLRRAYRISALEATNHG